MLSLCVSCVRVPANEKALRVYALCLESPKTLNFLHIVLARFLQQQQQQTTNSSVTNTKYAEEATTRNGADDEPPVIVRGSIRTLLRQWHISAENTNTRTDVPIFRLDTPNRTIRQ